MSKFSDLINKKCREFQDIHTEYEYIDKFFIQLKSVDKDKSFRINNSILYRDMFHNRPIQVCINLYNWIETMSSTKNNFLQKVRGQHFNKEVKFGSNKKISSSEDRWRNSWHQNHKTNIINKIFGGCKQASKNQRQHRDKFCYCHLDFLVEKFKTLGLSLKSSRDISCHPYEGISGKYPDMTDIKNAITECQEYIEYFFFLLFLLISLILLTNLFILFIRFFIIFII